MKISTKINLAIGHLFWVTLYVIFFLNEYAPANIPRSPDFHVSRSNFDYSRQHWKFRLNIKLSIIHFHSETETPL